MNRIVHYALSVAAIAITIAALINTADWLSCVGHKGGIACNESRNVATTSWTAFGMNALALATNILNGKAPRP